MRYIRLLKTMKNKRDILPHAILDKISRINKSKKIELLLGMSVSSKLTSLLEIGTGSGYIANYFSETYLWLDGVYAVDVVDQRQVKGNYHFKNISGTTLPYDNEKFKYILSNHVIEHVGQYDKQKEHLSEIHRCLEPNGILYLAVPNRWRIIEPHYRLPFLSWLPSIFAAVYLKIMKKGSYYDCFPLSRSKATKMLTDNGFEVEDVSLRAIKITRETEELSSFMRAITYTPKWLLTPFVHFIPTLIYICKKK